MVDDVNGLSSEEARKRYNQFGPNQIIKPYDVRFLDIVKEEIAEPLISLLLVVGVLYSIWGKLEDALTIFGIISVLVLVEVWNEYRAKKAIASLVKITAPRSKVIRNGNVIEISSDRIVPGDVIILSIGTRIPADSKLMTSYSLQIDESSLTGESFPKDKRKGDEIYAGTLVLTGEGRAQVITTGKETKIGQISNLAQTVKPPKTPLQLSMKDLSKKLIWVALFFSLLIPFLGFLRGQDYKEMILTGLSLAFATIPEEMPIIITMILGLGAYKLSKRNFLVKKLKAAETLGDATVIVTDKTGTITENKMTVSSLYPAKDEANIIKSALCALTEFSSSPIDMAIVLKAEELNVNSDIGNIVKERSFDRGRKTKSVIRNFNGKFEICSSGAPEEILKMCGHNNKKKIVEQIEVEANNGKRIIAIARKNIRDKKTLSFEKLEKEMEFVGLMSFEDPPRDGVKETIQTARKAGVRTIMVTGDHPKTALYIASQVGIQADKVLTGQELDEIKTEEELQKLVQEISVFARTTPEHKYRIVKALQRNGDVVAVTGDGVNDTIALKEADIGISMGLRGTDAAREVSDAILADDNYITIARALFEGRKFFNNLKKGVKYYLSVKTALILAFLLPIIFNIPFPFAPIQIIVIELFMDLAASSAFVAEPAEKNIYTRKSTKNVSPGNKSKTFLDAEMISSILLAGFILFATVMIAYLYALSQNLSLVQAQTFAFTTWIISHIALAFVSRSDVTPLYKLGLTTNKVMVLWAVGVLALLVITLIFPIAGNQLKLAPLTFNQLGIILLISFLPISLLELIKFFKIRNEVIA